MMIIFWFLSLYGQLRECDQVCLLSSRATIVCKCFEIMLLVFSVCLTLCEKQADIYCF